MLWSHVPTHRVYTHMYMYITPAYRYDDQTTQCTCTCMYTTAHSLVSRPLPREGRGSGVYCLRMRETIPGYCGVASRTMLSRRNGAKRRAQVEG